MQVDEIIPRSTIQGQKNIEFITQNSMMNQQPQLIPQADETYQYVAPAAPSAPVDVAPRQISNNNNRPPTNKRKQTFHREETFNVKKSNVVAFPAIEENKQNACAVEIPTNTNLAQPLEKIGINSTKQQIDINPINVYVGNGEGEELRPYGKLVLSLEQEQVFFEGMNLTLRQGTEILKRQFFSYLIFLLYKIIVVL